jgi:hypothetical protein
MRIHGRPRPSGINSTRDRVLYLVSLFFGCGSACTCTVSQAVSPSCRLEYQRMIPTLPHVLEAPSSARLLCEGRNGSTEVLTGRHVSAMALANGCVFAYTDAQAVSICSEVGTRTLPSSCVYGTIPPSRDGVVCGGCIDYCRRLSYFWKSIPGADETLVDHALPARTDSVRVIAFIDSHTPVVEVCSEPLETRVGAPQHCALWVPERGGVKVLADSTVGFPRSPSWQGTFQEHHLTPPARLIEGPAD